MSRSPSLSSGRAVLRSGAAAVLVWLMGGPPLIMNQVPKEHELRELIPCIRPNARAVRSFSPGRAPAVGGCAAARSRLTMAVGLGPIRRRLGEPAMSHA